MEIIDLEEVLSTEHSSGRTETEKSRGEEGSGGRRSPKGKKRPVLRELISFLLGLVLVFFVALFIVHFVGQRTQVNGESMEETLSDGDNLIVDKLSYRFVSPKRFDVIVFPHQMGGEEIFFIKRIIGLPGEKIQISNGVIYVDDVPLDEPYGNEVIAEAKSASVPVVLGEDEYFVLGDNRNHSMDSREIGPVPRKIIVGRAIFRIWPMNRFGSL